jgi:hypothetical protein
MPLVIRHAERAGWVGVNRCARPLCKHHVPLRISVCLQASASAAATTAAARATAKTPVRHGVISEEQRHRVERPSTSAPLTARQTPLPAAARPRTCRRTSPAAHPRHIVGRIVTASAALIGLSDTGMNRSSFATASGTARRNSSWWVRLVGLVTTGEMQLVYEDGLNSAAAPAAARRLQMRYRSLSRR